MPAVLTSRTRAVEASGGEMDGCIGGRWVMGVPYTQNASITLPPTTTYGVYESKLYDKIEPVKVELNATVTTAAEVRASRVSFLRTGLL